MNPILALRPDDKQSTPLYLQLARSLEAAIHAGHWKSRTGPAFGTRPQRAVEHLAGHRS